MNKEYLILPVAGFDIAFGILLSKRGRKKRTIDIKHTHTHTTDRERTNDVKIS